MTDNIYNDLPAPGADEVFQTLLDRPGLHLERIVSTGQATPVGQWYDQDRDEWVLLLSGSAELRFEDPPELTTLSPGDYVYIAAHRRHRVEWTAPDRTTLWLALHMEETKS